MTDFSENQKRQLKIIRRYGLTIEEVMKVFSKVRESLFTVEQMSKRLYPKKED